MIREHKWKVVAVGVAFAAAVFMLVRRVLPTFDWRLFGASISGLKWRWLALAVVFIYATYYGRALRWGVLLRPLVPRPNLRNLLSATIIGFTAIVLFGRAGEFVRPYLISVKERVPLSSQLSAWLLERIYDLLMALLIFGFALARVHSSGIAVGPRLTWLMSFGGELVAVLAAILLVMLLLIRHVTEPMRRRLLDALGFLPERAFERARHFVDAFAQGVASTRSDSALVLLAFYSILEWVLVAACYFCVARAYAGFVHLGLMDVLIFMGFVAFGAVVQIPGVGGGVQVVSVLVLRELFGVPLEVATSMAMLIWIITFVVILPPGFILALHEGLNWRSLRRIGREIEK